MKGKLIKWNPDRAFGFIAPNGGGEHVFIHKTALSNRKRTPKINDVITFSITKDNNGRYCASEATFSGEKFKKKSANKVSKFSIYLSVLFLTGITTAYFMGQFPQIILLGYYCISVITIFAYAFDKSKAQRGAWRTSENTLHLFSFLGGWPGAAIAQQLLRHKSQKQAFRNVFWLTVAVNSSALLWLLSSEGNHIIEMFK
ncbi:MAG: DUF1294 domain-containing protein [Colwellia sp.]|nr:DUF1294 domain-containing protein [Colwellia sp.]